MTAFSQSRPRLWLAAMVLLAASSCIQPTRDRYDPDKPYTRPYIGPDLEVGQLIGQGMIGVGFYDEVSRQGGANPSVPGSNSDLETIPSAGASWQHVFGTEKIDWGLEGGGTLGFRTGNGRVYTAGGVADVDTDLFLFDIFGGPFISHPLGSRTRVYLGAGPLVQIATFEQEGYDAAMMEPIEQEGTGFGVGYYARAGAEFVTGHTVVIGLGVRWLDSEVSLDDSLGRLEVSGLQVLLTLSSGY